MCFLNAFYFFLLPALLVGCASSEFNLATNRQETLFISTQKEISVGDSFARQLEKIFEVNTDIAINQRVQGILERLVAVSDRKELVYSIKILEDEKINAVSLPGGHIFLFKGLVDKIEDDDQLAGVVAHELGHITARHGIKRMQASYGATLLQVLAVASGDRQVAAGVNAALTTAFSAYSIQDEFEADRLAVKYTRASGYDPKAMLNVLELLKKEQERDIRTISYFRTHPHLNERMAALNYVITGELEFRDYINLMGGDAGF